MTLLIVGGFLLFFVVFFLGRSGNGGFGLWRRRGLLFLPWLGRMPLDFIPFHVGGDIRLAFNEELVL
jgi:hypothetical protein